MRSRKFVWSVPVAGLTFLVLQLVVSDANQAFAGVLPASTKGSAPAAPMLTDTPTPIETQTPVPTNTPPRMLAGHVTWQGRPAQPNALQQLPITLTLKSGTTEANYPS